MAVALWPSVTHLKDACRDPSQWVEKRLQASKNKNKEVAE
jgi:hypothetical protein